MPELKLKIVALVLTFTLGHTSTLIFRDIHSEKMPVSSAAPLQIRNTFVSHSGVGATTVHFTVKNISGKPVKYYRVAIRVRRSATSNVDSFTGSSVYLAPGRELADTLSGLFDAEENDVTLSLDYVQYVDGEEWVRSVYSGLSQTE